MVSTGASTPESFWVEHPETTQPSISHHIRDATQNGANADKEAYGSGIPFANVLEIITNTHLRHEHIPGRVNLSKSALARFSLRYGDVLFNRTSETQDEVALAAVYVGREQVVFGGFVIRGRPNSDALDPVFSGYALRSHLVRRQTIKMGQGAVRANVGQKDLSKISIPLPPIGEQHAIAAVLSDMDAEMTTLSAKRDKARALKQGMMQALLTGRIRLI